VQLGSLFILSWPVAVGLCLPMALLLFPDGRPGIFGGHAAYYHLGDNPGYQSLACWLPDQAASIVILVNDEAASITGLLRQLLPAALGP
jgi:hypothetical protein